MSLGANSFETDQLLQGVEQGDRRALAQLFHEQRPYLRRLLEARMEPLLRRRIDPSDVMQETFLVASRRIDDYLARRPTTFRLWLRRKAIEQLINARREHFALKRAVNREISLTDASSLAIAKSLVDGRAGAALQRKDQIVQVRQALLAIGDSDREILVLRNAEQLSNAEVADLLGIDPKTASKRYGRAVLRLADVLKSMESGST